MIQQAETGPFRVLIVEDDAPLAALIADYLGQQGYTAAIESRGDRAVARILAERPDLVVLDLTLPGEDGLSVCRRVRPSWSGPILMLTARGDESDEVVGLELGADDYLAKPVRPRVLLARVRALLRRPSTEAASGAAPDAAPLRVGDLAIDPGTRGASVGGTRLELTSGEFDVLWLLASHAGEVVRREVLYQLLLDAHYESINRSVDLRVSRLRQKIAAGCGDRERIKTVRGVGYLYTRS